MTRDERFAMTAATLRVITAQGDTYFVEASYDGEFGHWSGSLSLGSWGGKTPEAAALALAVKAEEFARALRRALEGP